MLCCVALDGVVRMGRSLKDKAPQSDHESLHNALVQLKTKWTSLCSKAVDRFVSLSRLCSLYVSLGTCLAYFVLFIQLSACGAGLWQSLIVHQTLLSSASFFKSVTLFF